VEERAVSLARQHREEEGIAALREAIAKDPNDVAARKVLVRLVALGGDVRGAQVEATELAKRLPAGDPSAWIELGHAFELAHRFEEALAAYDTAASVAPLSPAGPREGGMRCARWGEVEEAEPRLEEAIRRGANDGETWHALGLVRLHARDVAGAEEAYKSGLRADPESAENLLGLASVAVARDDAAGALAAYDALLAKRPRYAAAELGRAWALAKLGRKADARRALDRAEGLGAAPSIIAKQRAALER
jgi:tetratricopeptide (TPR) repeat protein